MATSGSTTWQLTRNEFIAAAIRKLSRYDKTASPDSFDYANGAIAFNAVVAELQTLGMQLWARNEYTFSLTANVGTYSIGVGQTLNTPFPLKLHQAVLIDTSGTRIDLRIESVYEYNKYPTNSSGGVPVYVVYQPKINVGELRFWPTPDTATASTKTVKLVYQRPFEDFTASGETADFPKEWHQTLIYKLAVALAPEYSVPLSDRQLLLQEAAAHEAIVTSFGGDDASIYFSPEYHG